MGELKNNRLLTVDLIKFVASLFVILIHCTFYGGLGITVKAMARFAVPFFFLSTGYFLYGNSSHKLLKKLRHMVGLALSAFVLYFAFYAVLSFVQKGTDGLLGYLTDFADFEKIVRFLAFNVPFSFTNLWYLFAVVYVYLIYYGLVKCKASDRLIFAIAFSLLAAHLLIWQVNLSLQLTNHTFYVRNFLFFGFPMITAGAFLKKHQQKIPKLSCGMLVLLSAIGASLSIGSRWLIGNKSLPLGAIILSVSLFVYAIQTKPCAEHSFLRKAGAYSTYIYILHPCVIRLVQLWAEQSSISHRSTLWINLMPIVVCVITVLFAVIGCTIKEKIQSVAHRTKAE